MSASSPAQPGAAAPRFLSRLRLSHFRNYGSAALDLDARPVVLVGPNGAGKTNLLEAISMLSPGRGLRRAAFETLATRGSESGWAVAATVETPDGPADIGTGWSAGEPGRRVRINGANARAVEAMSAYLRVLWLTPSMDGLFTGSPGDRRRFLDRLVTTLVPGHFAAVSDLEDAMRQRNRLLLEDEDPAWITAVERQMAELASAVHFARTDSLDQLQALAGAGDDFPAATLALTPLFDDAEPPASAPALEAELLRRWKSLRPLDRAAGRTTLGPHRVDLDVVHAQKGMPAALGSTGEQKALLIGLVLAQARLVRVATAIAPFLLLDEIAAHLDPGRREALFGILDGLGAQVFMTGTDPLLFEAIRGRAQQLAVSDGKLSPDR